MNPPRVRFAPAPSGWLHVGGARTALFNWLYARGRRGTFVLRIEDTDETRVSDESMQGMLDALRFLGLDWDEGPHVGGPHGPYRQSERGALYAGTVAALLQRGDAYDAWETPEELAAARERAQAEGRAPRYSGAHRDLSGAERERFRSEGRRPSIRLRLPDEGEVTIADRVRGDITFDWSDIGDVVIQRADGSPTYYLASTVDDLAMGIGLVARGEDLLSATPRQSYLTDLLLGPDDDWPTLLDRLLADSSLPPRPPEAQRPTYAHLPIIVGHDRKKLSKRHGAVSVDAFREQGYLPEVIVNHLALCGWGPEDDRERMTVDELVQVFDLDRVNKAPAVYDTAKLRDFNGERIRELTDDELAQHLQPILEAEGLVAQPMTQGHLHLLRGFAPLVKERIQTLVEAVPLVAFAFRDGVTYDEQAVGTHLKGRAGDVLEAAEEALEAVEPWDADGILDALDGVAERLELSRGKTMQPVRVAVAGSAVSPPLPETLALLDKAVVLGRLRSVRPMVTGD